MYSVYVCVAASLPTHICIIFYPILHRGLKGARSRGISNSDGSARLRDSYIVATNLLPVIYRITGVNAPLQPPWSAAVGRERKPREDRSARILR